MTGKPVRAPKLAAADVHGVLAKHLLVDGYDLVLDVNTQAQYEFMRELYDYLHPRNPEFHITDTIRWYDEVYLPKRRVTGAGNG